MKHADRLQVASTGTSAAVLTLGAAALGLRTLAQCIADGDFAIGDTGITFHVFDGAGNWEDLEATITSNTIITRTAVKRSSAGGTTAATFSGGPLTVFNTPSGAWLSTLIAAIVDSSGKVTGLVAPNGKQFMSFGAVAPSNADGLDNGAVYMQTGGNGTVAYFSKVGGVYQPPGTGYPTAPPVIATAPTVNGTPRAGVPMSITAGTFTGAASATRSIYCAGTLVAGPAVGATYVPVAGDVGKVFTVDEVGTNAVGITHNMSLNSAACLAAIIGAQQAVRMRSNDLYTLGSSGLTTCYYKVEFDEAFDYAQWVVTSTVSSGTPGTYKVQLAVTDTIAVDTINNAFVPMRGGVAYNDTSANGWQNATFNGAASKQIGLAPVSANNYGVQSMATDILPLASVARADGKAGGILLIKVVQVDTAGAYTQDKQPTNQTYDTARGAQTWFREFFSTQRKTVDGIANLTALPTSAAESATGYAIMGHPIVTTTTNPKTTDLVMFTGDSRKAAAASTYTFDSPNRQSVMSLSTAAHPISMVNACGSGHAQAQYLAVALDILNNGLRPTVIFLAGFSQNSFVDYTTFKTNNDNFMAAVRAIPGLANVKFVLDTDYYVTGYVGTAKETSRQQCISYAKSLANGTTVFCYDSDVIMTDYTTTPGTPTLRSAYMSGGDATHAGPAGQTAMAFGDGTNPGLQAMYKTVFGIA